MHTKLTFFLLFLSLALAACDAAAPDIYVADAQAQSTLAIARALQTGTAQAVAVRAQAATLSAAQTQDTLQLTRTAGTLQADIARSTATAQAAATATQQANQIATQAAGERLAASQTAWPSTQAALQKTQRAEARAEQVAALQSEWQGVMVPLKPILFGFFWVALVLLLVVGAVVAYRRFAPAIEQKLRTVVTDDGEVITLLPSSVKVNVIQPKRNLGAGLVVGPDGIRVDGIPEVEGKPALPAQERAVARLQAAQAFHQIPATLPAEDPRREFVQAALEGAGQNLPAFSEPPHIEIIDPREPEIEQIWDEVQKKLLLGRNA